MVGRPSETSVSIPRWGREAPRSGLCGIIPPNPPAHLPASEAGAAGVPILQVKRLGLEEALWFLARAPQVVQVGRMDLEKFGRSGDMGGELLPRVRELGCGWGSTGQVWGGSGGGQGVQAVLLGQKHLLGDLAGRGFRGPVPGCRVANALHSLQAPSATWGSPCVTLCPARPSLLRSQREPPSDVLVNVSQPSPWKEQDHPFPWCKYPYFGQFQGAVMKSPSRVGN